MDIRFRSLRRHILLFSHRIWFCNVQTTCLNLYVSCYVVALRNICMAALRKYPKNRKIIDFHSQIGRYIAKNAYSFLFIAKAYITFSHRIWFRNVQTTCLNLYVKCYVIALRNFCKAGIRKYHRN